MLSRGAEQVGAAHARQGLGRSRPSPIRFQPQLRLLLACLFAFVPAIRAGRRRSDQRAASFPCLHFPAISTRQCNCTGTHANCSLTDRAVTGQGGKTT